jgi:hypothetical protein
VITLRLIKRAEELNKESSFSRHPGKGMRHLSRLFSQSWSSFPVSSRNLIENYLRSGRVPEADATTRIEQDRVTLDFQASKQTWACHWFPMQETTPGGDPINNLYAMNGPLHKLDKVTGLNAQDYEFKTYRKDANAGQQFGWWGHCNNAAEAACLLQAPKNEVVMMSKTGEPVVFSPMDIQGLLVKVTPSLIERVDFRGLRFNDPARDDPSDPKPEVFMSVMKEWAKDGMPFVLDIERKAEVWNFPYDQVKITESTKQPEGFDVQMPKDGSVKYYQIEMSGTGFPNKNRVYQCFVQRNHQGQVISSSWIKTPNSNNNPDFMWRPHPIGDLMDRNTWSIKGPINNPAVDPKVVYDIYIKSLA